MMNNRNASDFTVYVNIKRNVSCKTLVSHDAAHISTEVTPSLHHDSKTGGNLGLVLYLTTKET